MITILEIPLQGVLTLVHVCIYTYIAMDADDLLEILEDAIALDAVQSRAQADGYLHVELLPFAVCKLYVMYCTLSLSLHYIYIYMYIHI